jgi:phosphoheptose isomerase
MYKNLRQSPCEKYIFGGALLMLKNWTSHADYQHFIPQAVSSFDDSQLKKLSYFSDSIAKLSFSKFMDKIMC